MKTVTSIIVVFLLFVGGTLKGDEPAKTKQVVKPVIKNKLVFDVKIHQPPKELLLELKKLDNNIKHTEVQLVEIKNHIPVVVKKDTLEVKTDTVKIPIKKKRTFIQKILNKN